MVTTNSPIWISEETQGGDQGVDWHPQCANYSIRCSISPCLNLITNWNQGL